MRTYSAKQPEISNFSFINFLAECVAVGLVNTKINPMLTNLFVSSNLFSGLMSLYQESATAKIPYL